MSKRRLHSSRRHPRPPAPRRVFDPSIPTDLYELERFSNHDLRRWEAASAALDEMQFELHFGLERQRRGCRAELLEALRFKSAPRLNLEGWVRIVDYRYCLTPLSAAGSLRAIGGRFNVGQDLGTAIGMAPWPALYVAQDLETAYREKYQIRFSHHASGLTPEELALQDPNSFLVAYLQGEIRSVLNLSDPNAVKPFCQKIGTFELPRKAMTLARKLGVKQPRLVRSPSALHRLILSPKWRVTPTQFELPAPSQIFGELVQSAGYEAMTFQSSRGGTQCVVIFPVNFAVSGSLVELKEPYPHQVELPRLDRDTWRELTTPF